jgi:hypothetical protein
VAGGKRLIRVAVSGLNSGQPGFSGDWGETQPICSIILTLSENFIKIKKTAIFAANQETD